jgi:hypothetical protein
MSFNPKSKIGGQGLLSRFFGLFLVAPSPKTARSSFLPIVVVLLMSMPAIGAQTQQSNVKAPYEITVENSRFAGIYESPKTVSVVLKLKNNEQRNLRAVSDWELCRLPSGETVAKGQLILTAAPGGTAQAALPFSVKAGYGLFEFRVTSVVEGARVKPEPARVSVMRIPPKDREMDNLGFNIHAVDEWKSLLLRRLGVRWARVDFSWDFAASPDNIPWGRFDIQVQVGEKYGMKLFPHTCCLPKWAVKPNGLFDPKEHADYIAKLLTRYKGKFPAIGVWNEPPVSFDNIWPDDLKEVRKTANAADPNCKIIGPGFATNPQGCLNYLLPPLSIGKYIDGVDFHNYPAPRNRRPEESSKYDNCVEDLEKLVPKMRALVAGREVWISEHGFCTCDMEHNYEIAVISPLSLTEKQQGDYLVRQLMLEYAYGIDRVFIYQLGPDGTAGDWESQLGITRGRSNGLSAKIAYVQIGNMIQEIAGATPVSVVKPAPDYRVVRFRRGSTEVVAVWKIRGSGKLTFRINSGYVSDPFGNRTPRNETAAFAISESPIFFVGKKVEFMGSKDVLTK